MHKNHIYALLDNSIKLNKPFQSIIFSSFANFEIDKYILYYINKLQNSDFKTLENLDNQLNIHILGNLENLTKDDVINGINESFSNMNKNFQSFLIIKNIENGSIQSINALLKYIESLPTNVFLIMTTNNKYNILKTILSRSVLISIDKDYENDFLTYLNNKNTKYTEFYQQFTNDKNFLDKIFSIDNEFILDEILSSFISKDQKLIRILTSKMTNDNCYLILNFLNFILLNVYRKENLIQPKLQIEWIKNINFKNSLKMFEIINKYINILNNNSYNFKIQKYAFLLELGEIYEE